MMRVIAIGTDTGQTFCGNCATELADWEYGTKPWEVEHWVPLTPDDLAITGQETFRAIRQDAIEQYPDFVKAGIDSFFVAQMDAAPHCDRCGLFLVGLEDPRKGVANS